MMLSVIVPVYNAERFLDRCVASILAQDFFDFELLLVDDGSMDGSTLKCEQWCRKDQRVRLIRKENGGASSARNVGINLATGKYICFVDADDFIEASYLSGLLAATKSRDVDLVIGGRSQILRDGTSKELRPCAAMYSKHSLDSLFREAGVAQVLSSPCAKLFRRDLIKRENLVFPDGIHYLEDSIFVLRYLLCCYSVMCVDTADYCYELHPGSLVSKSYPLDTELLAYDTFASLHEQFRARYDIPVREDDWFVWNRLFLFYRAMAAAKATASMKKKLDNFKRLDWDFYSKPIHPHTPRTILRKYLLTTFNKWGGAIIYLYLNRLGLL